MIPVMESLRLRLFRNDKVFKEYFQDVVEELLRCMVTQGSTGVQF